MTDHTLQQFGDELKSFFILVLLNMAFGALALGFGMQIILATFLQYAPGEPPSLVLSIVRILVGITGMCIGFFWILASMKILRGIKGIRKEYRTSARAGPVPAETLTGWIVALLAHYRENRTVLWRMTLISITGGLFYLALGIVNLVEGSLGFPAAAGPVPSLVAFFGAASINSGIGIVTLYVALRFRHYAGTWDLRLKLADEGEESLKKVLESR